MLKAENLNEGKMPFPTAQKEHLDTWLFLTNVILISVPPGSSPQNLIAQSQSGTGKTAAFVLAMLSRVEPAERYPQVRGSWGLWKGSAIWWGGRWLTRASLVESECFWCLRLLLRQSPRAQQALPWVELIQSSSLKHGFWQHLPSQASLLKASAYSWHAGLVDEDGAPHTVQVVLIPGFLLL